MDEVFVLLLDFDDTESGHAGNTFLADPVSLNVALGLGSAEDLSKFVTKPFGFRVD